MNGEVEKEHNCCRVIRIGGARVSPNQDLLHMEIHAMRKWAEPELSLAAQNAERAMKETPAAIPAKKKGHWYSHILAIRRGA